MNSSIVFHSADPEAIQSGYTAFDNCDFVINVGEGRSLVRNSVRLVGDLQINSTGTTRTLGEIYMDYRIGAHAMLDSLQVTFGGPGGGVKQNTQNYARWVSMTTAAEQSQADMLNASNQVELRAPNQLSVERYADGESSGSTQNIISNLDFALKPNCILNKMVGDHLPFEKSGEIRLTINLAKNTQIRTSWLYQLSRIINTTPSIYQKAGAIHGCVLCHQAQPLVYMEDVGRHNAVDKVAGWMRASQTLGANKILYTTGRLTSEMVIKCALMGIPVLASRSGFTAWGVELAGQVGLTLIGRMRGQRFQCLAGQERLVYDADLSGEDEGRKHRRKSAQ